MDFSLKEKVRISKFERKDLPHPLYVKTSRKGSNAVRKAPLVIHPDYRWKRRILDNIAGIHLLWDILYHNSNLSGFPKETENSSAYGIAIAVENREALFSLISALIGHTSNAKSRTTPEDDINQARKELEGLSETERKQIILARNGQGSFRSALEEYWISCAVSAVTMPEFLRASHIKPWRDSTNQERLDPFNGLLLNAHLDIAFDLGFISFKDDGSIMIGSNVERLKDEVGIYSSMRLRKVDNLHLPYLHWHRANVFLK